MKMFVINKKFIRENMDQFLLIDKEELANFDSWKKENFLANLPDKFNLSFGILENKELAGFLIASRKPYGLKVHRFAVKRSYQEKGFGSLLLAELKEKAQALNISLIVTETLKKDASLPFYQKNGFQILSKEQRKIVLSEKKEPYRTQSIKRSIFLGKNIIDTKIVFVGSKQLGMSCLKEISQIARKRLAAVITLDDRGDLRSVFESFKSFCHQEAIPLHVVKKKKEFNELIIKIQPDFCIVVGWYWLIDKEILDILPYGSVGVHGALLPKYRGNAPLVWAIINGEKEAGVSLFRFAEGMDNGDIFAQFKVKISSDDYIGDVLKKVEDLTPKIIAKNLENIISGKIKPKKQNHRLATYCAQRIPDDGKINWEKSAKEVYNFIRAQSYPYPGAFTTWNEKKVIIWTATLDKRLYYGTPGQVAEVNKDGIVVICGDNHPIILNQIQIDDKKLEANEVIRSVKIRFK